MGDRRRQRLGVRLLFLEESCRSYGGTACDGPRRAADQCNCTRGVPPGAASRLLLWSKVACNHSAPHVVAMRLCPLPLSPRCKPSGVNLPDANGHVSIPSGVTSIGDRAFVECQSLVSVSLPSGVTSIGRYSFGYCYSLVSVTLPSTLTSIGAGAFWKCWSKVATCVPTDCSIVTGIYGSFRFTGQPYFSSHCDTPPSPPLPPLPPPLSPLPPLLPPLLPPPHSPLPSPPPSPSCSSPSGRTYAYPCCANPSSLYAGMWVNARWVNEAWFKPHACSCIIPQGTDLSSGYSTGIDHCCY
mmetsp:Transcript_1308/g.2750  ORF Transcript_1308/g.2750 Transcript_1308/m.2750 type:complete len:298 (+) Transcript_1308:958-1851(+)